MDQRYLDAIEHALQQSLDHANLPPLLDEPIRYALGSGGKRLRPLITVLAAEACGATLEDATPAAAAIEILHNFTLIHDDIMDRSPLRRGQPTVHRKWNVSTAIIAGDAMMGIAYRLISESYPASVCQKLVAECSSAFVDICIGQAEDVAYSTPHDNPNGNRFSHESTVAVTLDDYLTMIGRKTARLFATAAVTGGIVAHAPAQTLSALHTFGFSLGMAFQIRDDMLDLFGTAEFGKRQGQDLREGKKTFPILSAASRVTEPDDKTLLSRYLAGSSPTSEEEINAIAECCRRLGVLDHANSLVEDYLLRARSALEEHLSDTAARSSLTAIAETTRSRNR